MKALFFGAGSTCGTFRNSDTPVPVAAHFGRVFSEMESSWTQKSEYHDLLKIVEHLGFPYDNWALEPVWTCADFYGKFSVEDRKKGRIAILRPPAWGGETRQLKMALLSVYGRRCDEAAKRLPPDGSYTLGALAQTLRPGDKIISFNYDTVFELLASEVFGHSVRSIEFDTPSAVMLAKPHGSTSWTLRIGGDKHGTVTWQKQGNPLLESLEIDADCHTEPLVLGSVPVKSELVWEVQEACGSVEVHQTIAKQWKAVVSAVSEAERLIVVGYSFPREDQYGRFLIQEGVRLRKNKPIIEFYELEEYAGERAKAILETFENKVEDLIYRGPVNPPSPPRRRLLGTLKGTVRSMASDFDAPLEFRESSN